MSKDLLKIALIGLAATFCISAKQAHNQKEVAMAKCSKENSRGKKCYEESNGKMKCPPNNGKNKEYNVQDQKDCNSRGDCKESTSRAELRNGYSLVDYSPASDEIAGKRKSAAQKVLEGY